MVLQGIFVDLIVFKFGYFRVDVDKFVYEFQMRVSKVESESCFKFRIVVQDVNGLVVLNIDENICFFIIFEGFGNL